MKLTKKMVEDAIMGFGKTLDKDGNEPPNSQDFCELLSDSEVLHFAAKGVVDDLYEETLVNDSPVPVAVITEGHLAALFLTGFSFGMKVTNFIADHHPKEASE